MDSNKLKVIIVVTLVVFFAIYLGIATASAQMEAIAWVSGALALVGLLALGRHVWILIPLSLSFSAGLNFLPGGPSVWYIATPLTAIFLLLRFLSRTSDFVWRWTWIDTLVFLNLAILIQAYMRNPTGLAIFGGAQGMIGGKQYIDYGVVTVGFFLLGTVKTEWKTVRIALYLMVGFMIFDSFLGAATSFSSTLAAAVSKVYGNVDCASATAGLSNEMGQGNAYGVDSRFGNLAQIGIVLGLVCCTFWRPLTSLSLIRPYRPIMLLFALACILMSGFRSLLTRFVFLFVAGSLVRRKPLDLIFAVVMGTLLLCVMMVGGLTEKLPHSAQRALSFLPVGVSESIKNEGESSSQWRFDMWRLALTTDRYISNKILGDGFGFTEAEFRMSTEGMSAHSAQEAEDFTMSKGSYHGFHVECIRFVGVIGLLIGTMILLACCAKSWELIRYFEGRPGWPALLFICVPYLIDPIHYWFVFGSYRGGFMTYLLGAGILKVLDNVRVRELAEANAQMQQTTESVRPWMQVRRSLADSRIANV